MNEFPKRLKLKLDIRDADDALRKLTDQNGLVDFSSNDYLGLAQSKTIFNSAHKLLVNEGLTQNSSTGSRLLTGNHKLFNVVETLLCNVYGSESAVVFNSGYNANLGFFSSVPQKGDIILYDEYIHASIRDGITMSHAKAYKFKHNDLANLEKIMKRNHQDDVVYVVTESVFSMDGDSPDFFKLSDLCVINNCHLIVDEAHAIGVHGNKGEGLISQLELQDKVFARIMTFGKGLGAHGAAILGNKDLKQYLINFSRPFIYTTALPPHSLATIRCAYEELYSTGSIEQLNENIMLFKTLITKNGLQDYFIDSNSAIHSCVIPRNETVKSISQGLKEKGFDVKAILSPTVPEGQERLRFCLHAYNTSKEIEDVLGLLATFV